MIINKKKKWTTGENWRKVKREIITYTFILITVELKSDGDTDFNWNDQYGHHRFGTGFGGLGNKRTSWHKPNYSNIETGQNTKKGPENLWRLDVTEDSSGKPSSNAMIQTTALLCTARILWRVRKTCLFACLLVCLFVFYGISTIVGYLMSNLFYTKEHFY